MRVRELSLPVPVIEKPELLKPFTSLIDNISSFYQKSAGYLFSFLSKVNARREKRNEQFSGSHLERKSKFSLGNKGKYIKISLTILVLIIFVVLARQLVNTNGGSTSADSTKVTVEKAKASQEINREFSFPLKSESGEQLGDIKYMIEKAELMDEIVVKGQKATAVKGRTFLILTLKITNEYKSAIQMNSKDYVRLSVNDNRDEWLAPDIHNDPVEVQAISTKYTRLGFPINDNDKDLVLRVGEIDSEKQEIPLKLN